MKLCILKVHIGVLQKKQDMYILHKNGLSKTPIEGMSQIIIIDENVSDDVNKVLYNFLHKSMSDIASLHVFCHLGYKDKNQRNNQRFKDNIRNKFSKETQTEFNYLDGNRDVVKKNLEDIDKHLNNGGVLLNKDSFMLLQNNFIKLFMPKRNELNYLHYLYGISLKQEMQNEAIKDKEAESGRKEIDKILFDNTFYKELKQQVKTDIKEISTVATNDFNDLLIKIRDVIIP